MREEQEERLQEIESTVDYLRGQVTELESRLDNLSSKVTGHSHRLYDGWADTDAWWG